MAESSTRARAVRAHAGEDGLSQQTSNIAIAFLFGLLFGSFLNAAIHRVPLGVDIFRRSFCPRCGKQIRWYHNVPLFSWLWLRGRCRDCDEGIPLRYPAVEFAGGLIAAAAVAKFGLGVSAGSVALFCYLMLVLALIDVDHRILPNVITLPFTVVGIGLSFVDPRITWVDSLIGAFFGGGLLYFVAWMYLKMRGRDGMGMGDVKMMLLVGAFLGLPGALMTIFIGSLLGSVIGIALIRLSRKDWEYALPFGTFLAAAAGVVAFWGPEIATWYWSTFGVAD